MYHLTPLTGASLPNRTLCLTFDDGPGETGYSGAGPRTLEVGRYLHGYGIPATFFVVGKYAFTLPESMSELKSLGHLIGNHTYEHVNLKDHLRLGGDVSDPDPRVSPRHGS